MKILHNYSLSNEELELLIAKEDKLVTVKEARSYFNGCIPGWKEFSSLHGFQWKTVLRHGLPSSVLYKTGDSMAINLVKHTYLKDISNV